jgi:hypothetical protein
MDLKRGAMRSLKSEARREMERTAALKAKPLYLKEARANCSLLLVLKHFSGEENYKKLKVAHRCLLDANRKILAERKKRLEN